jgi:hypothetical protein
MRFNAILNSATAAATLAAPGISSLLGMPSSFGVKLASSMSSSETEDLQKESAASRKSDPKYNANGEQNFLADSSSNSPIPISRSAAKSDAQPAVDLTSVPPAVLLIASPLTSLPAAAELAVFSTSPQPAGPPLSANPDGPGSAMPLASAAPVANSPVVITPSVSQRTAAPPSVAPPTAAIAPQTAAPSELFSSGAPVPDFIPHQAEADSTTTSVNTNSTASRSTSFIVPDLLSENSSNATQLTTDPQRLTVAPSSAPPVTAVRAQIVASDEPLPYASAVPASLPRQADPVATFASTTTTPEPPSAVFPRIATEVSRAPEQISNAPVSPSPVLSSAQTMSPVISAASIVPAIRSAAVFAPDLFPNHSGSAHLPANPSVAVETDTPSISPQSPIGQGVSGNSPSVPSFAAQLSSAPTQFSNSPVPVSPTLISRPAIMPPPLIGEATPSADADESAKGPFASSPGAASNSPTSDSTSNISLWPFSAPAQWATAPPASTASQTPTSSRSSITVPGPESFRAGNIPAFFTEPLSTKPPTEPTWPVPGNATDSSAIGPAPGRSSSIKEPAILDTAPILMPSPNATPVAGAAQSGRGPESGFPAAANDGIHDATSNAQSLTANLTSNPSQLAQSSTAIPTGIAPGIPADSPGAIVAPSVATAGSDNARAKPEMTQSALVPTSLAAASNKKSSAGAPADAAHALSGPSSANLSSANPASTNSSSTNPSSTNPSSATFSPSGPTELTAGRDFSVPVPAPASLAIAPQAPAQPASAPEVSQVHQILDSAPAAPLSPPPAPIVPGSAADSQMNAQANAHMNVGLRTDAFGAVQIHTVVQQSQIGITVHADRDIARWFSSEVPGLESGLNNSRLNLTAVNFEKGSGMQTGTGFQQGQPRQNPSQTSASPTGFSGAAALKEDIPAESATPEIVPFSRSSDPAESHFSIHV